MASLAEQDTDTKAYLLEAIRLTASVQDLVDFINHRQISVPVLQIPTGNTRSVQTWGDELRTIGIQDELITWEPTQQNTQPQQARARQAVPIPSSTPGFVPILPKPQTQPSDTPPTAPQTSTGSSGKKRGRPTNASKAEQERQVAQQGTSAQEDQPPAKKKTRGNRPSISTIAPPAFQTTPSMPSTTTSTTTPGTITSSGPDTGSFSFPPTVPHSQGLAISAGSSYPSIQRMSSQPRQPGPDIFSPSPSYTYQPALPVPQPNISNTRQSDFTLPGIASGPGPFFSNSPSSFTRPQSHSRAHSHSRSQPPTPSYSHPQPPQHLRNPAHTYESTLPPRSEERRKRDDDPMEH